MIRQYLGEPRGLTLIEILVTLCVFLIILSAIYSIFESSQRTYALGAAKTTIQQNARVALEQSVRDLRLAGYGFPTAGQVITDATPTSLTFWADLTNTSTRSANDTNAGDTTLAVQDAAGIHVGDTIYLINGGESQQLRVQVVNTGVNPNTITVNAGATTFYPSGSPVGRPTSVTFCWNDANGSPGPPNCGPEATTLYKDAGEGGGWEPLADDVQTFQLRYFDADDSEILPPIAGAELANIRRITIDLQIRSSAGYWEPQTFTITSDVHLRNL